MMTPHAKKGIALLITVMFVIVISVAIGYGLSAINRGASVVQKERFLYQCSLLLEDVLSILQSSNDLKTIAESNNSVEELNLFLSQAGVIPFSTQGIDILITIESGRKGLNLNSLSDLNVSNMLRVYCTKKGVNSQYVDILLDGMSGLAPLRDGGYRTRLFEEYPQLFRDYIASQEQLAIVNNFYTKEYHDNTIQKLNTQQLFYFPKDRNDTAKVDLNYATPAVWELMLGCDEQRAQKLVDEAGFYTSVEELNLQEDEKNNLQKFQISFFEPFLEVKVEFSQGTNKAIIEFEYNIKKAKGSHFIYEI